VPKFDEAAANSLLGSVFAPWVRDLDLAVERLEDDGAVLRMRFSERLCRDGGLVCGQALMSLADTAMVFAVCAASGGYRPMTTVNQTTHFLRPARGADLLAHARVLRLGRTMAFGQVLIMADGDTRPVASAQLTYAVGEGSPAHARPPGI